MKRMGRRHYIDVLSDSTGDTAERVIRAALLQFPQSGVEVRRHARIRTKQRAEPILEQAARDNSLLVFTVVSPELNHFINARALDLRLAAVDVIGSLIGRLSSHLERDPINRPGSLMPLSDDYFRRIEAVEFTVKSDAGRDPRSFLEADLVLVGVSRTSKTPVATLLAQRGLKVANLTLAVGVPTPAELTHAPQDRIFGLIIDAERLCAIREDRLSELGMPADTQYAVRAHVEHELTFASELFARNPQWPIVDISQRSVDETAGIILELMRERLANPPMPRSSRR